MLSTTEATRERPMVTRRRERSETGPAKAASTKTSPSDKTATIAGCPKTKACRFCTVRTNNRWICTPSLVKCRVRCTSNLVCFILNRPSSNLCLNNLLLSNNLVNINNFETTSLSVHKSWTGYMFKSLYFKIKLTISIYKPFSSLYFSSDRQSFFFALSVWGNGLIDTPFNVAHVFQL